MMGEWGWGFGGGVMIVWWLLVIVGIAALAKWLLAASGKRDGDARRALDILDARYARGEIEREEYERKRRDLERQGPAV